MVTYRLETYLCGVVFKRMCTNDAYGCTVQLIFHILHLIQHYNLFRTSIDHRTRNRRCMNSFFCIRSYRLALYIVIIDVRSFWIPKFFFLSYLRLLVQRLPYARYRCALHRVYTPQYHTCTGWVRAVYTDLSLAPSPAPYGTYLRIAGLMAKVQFILLLNETIESGNCDALPADTPPRLDDR